MVAGFSRVLGRLFPFAIRIERHRKAEMGLGKGRNVKRITYVRWQVTSRVKDFASSCGGRRRARSDAPYQDESAASAPSAVRFASDVNGLACGGLVSAYNPEDWHGRDFATAPADALGRHHPVSRAPLRRVCALPLGAQQPAPPSSAGARPCRRFHAHQSGWPGYHTGHSDQSRLGG